MNKKLIWTRLAFILFCFSIYQWGYSQCTDPPVVTVSSYSATCGGSCDGGIFTTVSGGTQPYTYMWTPSGATDPNPTNLCPGAYNLIVTDAIGCTYEVWVEITEPNPISINANTIDPSPGNNDGFIDLFISGGVAPYTYQWNTGNITEDLTGLPAGEYCVIVTDGNNCTEETCVELFGATVEAGIEGPSELCIGECGIFLGYDATGGGSPCYTFSWYTGSGIALSTNESVEFCPTDPGPNFLILELYDCQGNQSTTEMEINVVTTMPLEIVSTSPASCPDNNNTSACDKTCANSTITYTVPGSQSMDLNWEVLGAESYEVDNNIVTVNWGGPGTGEINVTSGETINGACALQLNCVQNKKAPNGNAIVYHVNGQGPYTYQWSDGQTGQSALGLAAGTYQVTVTNGAGESASCEVIIQATQPNCSNSMVIGPASIEHTSCNSSSGGFIGINPSTPSGNYELQWSNGSSEPVIYDLTADTYCVTITDDVTGCILSQCFTICDPEPIYLNAYVIDISSSSGGASAAVQVFGGTPPYNYSWGGTNNSPTIDGLSTGTHVVQVIDANGCSAVAVVDVPPLNFPACELNVYIEIDDHPSSCYVNDGSVTANITGGNGPYSISWNDFSGSTSLVRTDLEFGSPCITVTDADDCESIHCVILNCDNNITPTSCIGIGSLCIDIIDEPLAKFSSDPVPVAGVIELCLGETVHFFNESENAENYVWELGDGYATSSVDVSHAYTQSGVFDVLLIARNECFCFDTTSVKVLVSNDEIPEIECVGTVCTAESVTYSTTADCNNFIWTVSGNGVITDGGQSTDNFVTIEWGIGPIGEVSVQVSNCTGNYCSNPTVVQIPIITDGVLIEGPAKVCPGEIGTYSVPLWSATEYVWSVSEYGEIKSGQGSNTVTVKWNVEIPTLDPQWVNVTYENCYLGCSGESNKEVNITPDFYVAGPIEVCEDNSSDYAAFDEVSQAPVACNWVVLDPNGGVFWNSPGASTTVSVDWPLNPGKYSLIATAVNADDYCTDGYNIFVNVTAGPPLVDNIDGQNSICPGEFYTYSAVSTQANVAFNWVINNGGTLTENAGTNINVQWGMSPPYELTITQTSTSGLACESQPFTMVVDPIAAISLDGPTNVCIEATNIYYAPTIGNAPYDWTLSPAAAGSILQGQGSDSIQVIWNEAGIGTVSVAACGVSEELMVNVSGYPDPMVMHPDTICVNETGLVSATTPFSTYSWRNEAGNEVSNASTVNLGPGFYELVVTNSAGCEGQTTFRIHEYPLPVINISTPGLDFYCIPAGFPIPTLYALNTEEGYTYEWYQNGSPLGVFANTYTPSGAGTFYVEVIDINGCSSISNIFSLVENCGTGGGPPSPPGVNCNGVSNIYNNGPTCDHGIFLNTSTDYLPGSVFWNFDDPASGANNISTLENPEHFFTAAGFYGVQMAVTKLNGTGCILHKPFEVPAQANFDFVSTCPGLPVIFEDITNFTPGTTITNWDWDFGDPASGTNNTSNLQDPEHIYSSVGTYTVSLTINAQTGCSSTITREVTVLAPPVASFQTPNVSCQATALAFNIDMNPGITSFEWNFDDPASGGANTSQLANTFHAFSAPGIYDVQLKVYNIYGCSDSTTLSVPIDQNNLSGDITMFPGSPICEGDQTTVSPPPGGIAWNWSDGSSTETLTYDEAATFEVTITDAQGCTYSPPTATLDIIAQPEATIKVTEYNEYGQPADCFFSGYILCEGEDVFLSVSGAGDYSYTWSNGQNGDEVIYDDEHGGTLSVGDHDFEVTVTDNISGCTSVVGPFSITVNPVPTDIQIISSPPGPICEQTTAVFTVSNPDPDLTYLWSTGEYGLTITATTVGEYFVRGISSFGCEGESNVLNIFAAPDINLVPDGCHTRCNPDTICLPNIPGIVAYQWYLDGVAIPAPAGNDPNFMPMAGGEYHVDLFDVNGCSATSNPFSIDLLPQDTSNLELGACDGTTVEYNGEVLSPGSVTEFHLTNQYGCDSMITVTVLVDVDFEEDVVLATCPGNSIIYNGESYFAGTATVLEYTSQFGCDSIINLSVNALPESTEAMILSACDGEEIIYDGEILLPGTTTNFTFMNQFGCDSLVTVEVIENASYDETIDLQGCEGTTVSYEGVDYPVGTNQTFDLSTYQGCDSTINLNIEALQNYNELMELSTCNGSTISLPNGLELEAGADTTLLLITSMGCDSIIQITVEGVEAFETNVDLGACEGSTVSYEGVDYAPGTDLEFNFTSQQGCDSTIFLSVATLPVQNETISLSACTGSPIEYNGEMLEPGSSTDYMWTNQYGCDSLITVEVSENEVYFETIDLEGCDGADVIYDGNSYPAGTNQTLSYTTMAGCDSTIVLNIAALPLSEENITLAACAGSTIEYAGDQLAPGSVTSYTFTNQFDCDSTVVVSVSELPTQNETVDIDACDGQSIVFDGTSYPAGTQTVLTYTNQFGCDSTINLNVGMTPTFLTPITLQACEGTMAEYNGNELAIGSSTSFEFTSVEGCDSLVVVDVEAYPTFEFFTDASDLICWNSVAGEIQVTDIDGGVGPFTYSLDGVNYQDADLWTSLSAGDYTVYAQDGNGCIEESSVSIPLIPPLEVGFQVPTISCEADSILIQSFLLNGLTDSMSYVWRHGFDGLTVPAYDPGTYVLDVQNQCETRSFEVDVKLENGSRGSYFYVPNAFSPNADGVNDIFRAYLGEGLTATFYELHLYDRWGNELYMTNDHEEGWDGVFLDEAMNPGVYVWWLRATVLSCREEKAVFMKGDITIMK